MAFAPVSLPPTDSPRVTTGSSDTVCPYRKGFCPGGHDMVSENLGSTRGLCTPHPWSAEGLVVAPHFLSRTWKPKAKDWTLSITTGSQPSGGELTLVSESVSEEEDVGGSLGELFQDFRAQHT